MSIDHHLAQANIAKLAAPLTDPRLSDFLDKIESINAAADSAEGFVWRAKDDTGNSTYLRAFDRDDMLFNMSVWQSAEHLWNFVYGGQHLDAIRLRRRWFVPMDRSSQVLWWIDGQDMPSVSDAEARFQSLWERGPSPFAFTFKRQFPRPRN